ncbi:dTDP-4-dehydrorhamnose reductase [Burkholderia sp. MR1]|nr:dTDP-4-dehydrorhamnose reductase [Burkholderia sp. MR1]
MKILLTGANGQVGWELRRALQPLGQVCAVSRQQLDLCDPDATIEYVGKIWPDVIVNAAAYTAVDRAEDEPEAAFAINRDAVAALARASEKCGALLIHYSTDYVFDGSKSAPYLESDAVKPVNVYGQSKLEGEAAIQRSTCDWLVFRTTWVFASRGQNFVKTMLQLATSSESLRVVKDQFGAPTSARLIADLTAHAIRGAMRERDAQTFESALLNLTASGSTSWHKFAETIFAGAKKRGADHLLVKEVHAIPASDYPTKAARPMNSVLDGTALEQRFGIYRADWAEGLDLVLDELFSENRN